jgi:hypothetical protein
VRPFLLGPRAPGPRRTAIGPMVWTPRDPGLETDHQGISTAPVTAVGFASKKRRSKYARTELMKRVLAPPMPCLYLVVAPARGLPRNSTWEPQSVLAWRAPGRAALPFWAHGWYGGPAGTTEPRREPCAPPPLPPALPPPPPF